MNSDSIQNMLLKATFYITFSFLVTTGTITFIESISTPYPFVRSALNLETCISIVAAYFYGIFMKKLKLDEKNLDFTSKGEEINFKEINKSRYMDWCITTPIMLLVLLQVFGINMAKNPGLAQISNMPTGKFFGLVLIFNYLMLGFGFIVDVLNVSNIKKHFARILGFLSYAALYGVIGLKYIWIKNPITDNNIIFYTFAFFWFLYGVVNYFGEKLKNISYNILDLFAKCFVGIFFWAYLTGSVQLLSNSGLTK